MKIKCLIVDDEPLARDLLESYVQQIEVLELVGLCKSALEAFNWMQRENIDLVFLDINMPKLSGIDFLKTMKPKASIIFTTAHRKYAVESYELEALDYLIKPISFPRILQAVNRFLKSKPEHQLLPSSETLENTATNKGFLFIKSERKMIKVFFDEILYIESLKDYSRIFTLQKNIVTAKNLLYLENRLPDSLFKRIHKSYIIAIPKVKSYSSSEVEITSVKLPIGRTYKSAFLAQMKEKEE